MINTEQIQELNKIIEEIAELYRQKIKYIVDQTSESEEPLWKLEDLLELRKIKDQYNLLFRIRDNCYQILILSKKISPTESLITYVTKRLEQLASSTPEDFSQTIFTPQPLSVVTSPQDSTTQSPKADEPDKISSPATAKAKSTTKSPTIPKHTRPGTKSKPFSTVVDLLEEIDIQDTAIETESSTSKEKSEVSSVETNLLAPPKSHYPSSQPNPVIAEGSSSSTWSEKTSHLQQRIRQGEYFGQPKSTTTSNYSDNSFAREPQRLRTRKQSTLKFNPSKQKRKQKEEVEP
ncbi:21984_t:CDS:2, partial [Dentiscutata erythropus]